MPDSAPDRGDIAISLSGISKRFPGVLANDDISLTFKRGEVHALLGENGAGKSTLISMLAGMLQPDRGRIFVAGRPVRITSPHAALKLGIGTVYQHVLLVPSLSVLENLMLGSPWWRPMNRSATLERFRELSERLAIDLDPDALLGRLSLGQQQQVEIMRALWHGELALILDEPTSMLTPQGVAELAAVIRRLRDHGVAIIFITHKLAEAYELADRISVLRRGRVVGEILVGEILVGEILVGEILVGELAPDKLKNLSRQAVIDAVVEMMFGRTEVQGQGQGQGRQLAGLQETLLGEASEHAALKAVDRSAAPVLSLSGASTRGEQGECPLREVSFTAWAGEVLGIAGVDGNGQKHLAEALAGQRLLTHGSILLHGRDISRLSSIQRRALGVRYITDERLGEGTAGAHSVATNLVLKEIGNAPFWQHGLTYWRRIYAHARRQIDKHDIRTPSERTAIAHLSGGNIQKVMLARELSLEATLIIFNKPTHGLDLQSTKLARERIRAGAGAENAVLIVISNELDELMETCHRIAVMESGRVRGIVANTRGAETEIGRLMTGVKAA